MTNFGRKPQRSSVPAHIRRAVQARDGNRCKRCGAVTEFLHLDHLIPLDVGGPNSEDNLQLLCPTCNTSKGNSLQCRTCGHWMSPKKSHCTQCETPLVHTKYSRTLRGRVDRIIHKVGIAAIIAISAGTIVLILGGTVLGIYLVRLRDSAGTVNTIVNESVDLASQQGKSFKVTFPPNAKNSRIVGGFKVVAGPAVGIYVVPEAHYAEWLNGNRSWAVMQRENTMSLKIRQLLAPGTYYICLAESDPNRAGTVAIELYAKYD